MKRSTLIITDRMLKSAEALQKNRQQEQEKFNAPMNLQEDDEDIVMRLDEQLEVPELKIEPSSAYYYPDGSSPAADEDTNMLENDNLYSRLKARF